MMFSLIEMNPCKHCCVFCTAETYCNCVKCHEAVSNRPEYVKLVDESTNGYSEDHPKAVGICITCSAAVTRKRQSSISTFFNNKAR